MSDPTFRLTFQDMQIRVADYLGIADRSGSSLAVPSDPKNLELVKRFVNDGYGRFLSDNEQWQFMLVPLVITFVPQLTFSITSTGASTFVCSGIAGQYANNFFSGFEFTVAHGANTTTAGTLFTYTVTSFTGATGTFTITGSVDASIVAGDSLYIGGSRNVAGMDYRLYLPDNFYGLWKSKFTYDQFGPRMSIIETSESYIREKRAMNRTTGTPVEVAFRSIDTTEASTGKRWEAIFWPSPSQALSVTAQYRRFPNILSNNSDVSVAGFHHDRTVLASALAAAELYRNDKVGVHEATYQARLETSKKLDKHAIPNRTREYGDKSDTSMGLRPSSDFRAGSYNSAPFTFNG